MVGLAPPSKPVTLVPFKGRCQIRSELLQMMKRVLLRAIAIGKRRDWLKDSALLQYRADLERRMDAIMKLRPTNRHGIRLRKRFAKIRSNLFVFVTALTR